MDYYVDLILLLSTYAMVSIVTIAIWSENHIHEFKDEYLPDYLRKNK